MIPPTESAIFNHCCTVNLGVAGSLVIKLKVAVHYLPCVAIVVDFDRLRVIFLSRKPSVQ